MSKTTLRNSAARWACAALLSATMAACAPAASHAQEGLALPAPALDEESPGPGLQVAVLAGGCFWGVQGVFQHTKGVVNAVSGYAGGAERTAVYEVVGSGETGHAESVQITYDPSVITYGEILQVFFSVAHDPTQLNRQGPDRGTQYRSAIFPQDEEQAQIARAYIAQLNRARLFDAAIVTKIEPGHAFYPAEDYHQDYLFLHPDRPYIVINDLPKIENLRTIMPEVYRDDPVLVSEASQG